MGKEKMRQNSSDAGRGTANCFCGQLMFLKQMGKEKMRQDSSNSGRGTAKCSYEYLKFLEHVGKADMEKTHLNQDRVQRNISRIHKNSYDSGQDPAPGNTYIIRMVYIKPRTFLDKLGDYYFLKSDSAPPIQETLLLTTICEWHIFFNNEQEDNIW